MLCMLDTDGTVRIASCAEGVYQEAARSVRERYGIVIIVIMPPMSLPCLHTHHLVLLFRDVISAGHSGYLTVSLLYIPPLVVKVCEATKLPDTQRVGKQVRFTAPVLAS